MATWPKPLCLIESTPDYGVKINQDTVDRLIEVKEDIVVVGIAGFYRTGKSYLMNLLAEKPVFELGSTVESKTKGIWIWVMPHPNKANCCLAFLDTEGLSDADKGSQHHDRMIFTLVILLSSSITYNSWGTIDDDAINDLYFVTDIAKHIKVNSHGEKADWTNFASVFPDFIWVVRDFTVRDQSRDSRDKSSDAYLEKVLKPKKGSGAKNKKFNHIRACLRSYFPSRRCFTFPPPVVQKSKMAKLDKLRLDEIDPDFVNVSRHYRDCVIGRAQRKTILGHPINGRVLANLAISYLEAITTGATPCVESAVEAAANIENRNAIDESVEFYKLQMKARITLPTESAEALREVHQQVEREAMAKFFELRMFDISRIYEEQMAMNIRHYYEGLCRENEDKSEEMYRSKIKKLYSPIAENVKNGTYAVPGGYQLYTDAMNRLKIDFQNDTGNGFEASKTLDSFFESKEGESDSIAATDKKMTSEQERKAQVEAEKRKREKEEAKERARKEQSEKEARKRTLQNLKDEAEKRFQDDVVKYGKHSQKVLDAKLKEQKILYEAGFVEEGKDMQEQIDRLEREVRESSWYSLFGKVVKQFPYLELAGELGKITLSYLKRDNTDQSKESKTEEDPKVIRS